MTNWADAANRLGGRNPRLQRVAFRRRRFFSRENPERKNTREGTRGQLSRKTGGIVQEPPTQAYDGGKNPKFRNAGIESTMLTKGL
jgi:hypothetical protein